jgi:predicted DsbA family dithiol-disulfide isomerase
VRFQKAVKSGRWLGVIREEKAGGQQVGITGTPTLVLARVDASGQMASIFTTHEPKDYRQLKRALDRAMRGRR